MPTGSGRKLSDDSMSPSRHLGKSGKAEFYFVVQTTDGFQEIPSSRVLSVEENYIIVKSELKQSLKETKDRIEWLYERIKALEEASTKDNSASDAPVLT